MNDRQYPALYGRTGGLLRISTDRMEFLPDDPSALPFSISTSNVEVSLEGANSHHFRLTDKLQRANTVVIQDIEPIAALAERGNLSAQEASRNAKRKSRLRAAIASSPLIFTLVLLLAVPVLLSFVPMNWLNGALSHQQERSIGKLMLPILTNEKLETSAAMPSKSLAAIRKIAEHLQASNPSLKAIQFDFHISPSTDVNAYALPGGIIVMNVGLLQKAESAEEIAGVLAHEMAHVERRHTFKSLANRIGYFAGLIMLSTIVGSDAAVVIAKGTDLVSLKHSRDDEREADAQGLIFLRNAKVDASGMISFFKKLNEQEASTMGATSLRFLSTHPLSSERVEKLNEQLKQDGQVSQVLPLPVTLDDLQSTP